MFSYIEEEPLFFENFDITSVVSPVDVNRLEYLLKESKYCPVETAFLVDGFKNGFDLGYRGRTDVQRRAPNLKLRVGSETILWNKVMKEVKLGRFAGPFKEIPFKYYIQSPIGLVPKDGGKATRLIFHLSYPKNGESVNSETPEEFCTVTYADFADAVRQCMDEINAHGSCVVAKSDMSSAFRHFGMKTTQFCWLILMAKSPIDNKIYFFCDKSMPFGSSVSCQHFTRFSNCVAHLTQFRTGKRPVNYLDDYLFIAYIRSLCNHQVRCFLAICSEIRFPVSMEKTFWSTTELTFLGFLINTIKQFVSIPVDKVQRATDLIEEILNKDSRKVTVHQMQKLCGFLNFLCKCIVPGRAFTRRLYSYFSSSMLPHHHIKVNGEMRSDLQTWQKFLKEPTVYCRPFMDYSRTLYATDLDFYTDASGVIGGGGICFNQWFKFQWSKEFLAKYNPSIQYLEMYALTVGILLWLKDFSNKRICVFTDNKGVRDSINESSSGCKQCMVLIRLVVLECLAYNVRLFAKYVESEKNNFSDALSRNQMKRFHKDAVKYKKVFDDYPREIPQELWPIEKLWLKN